MFLLSACLMAAASKLEDLSYSGEESYVLVPFVKQGIDLLEILSVREFVSWPERHVSYRGAAPVPLRRR